MADALANDNRTPAGRFAGSELRISLDAREAMWHPDGDENPGVPMLAFAESGRRPQIPGPLIRVRAGTVVVATVRNTVAGTVLTVHGMVDRPAIADRPVRVPYGTTRVVRFRAGAPGTYLYYGTTSASSIADRFGADSQLSGALVVDPAVASAVPDDRILVFGQWINVRGKTGGPVFRYELDTINGRTWPHTERLSYAKDATVRWRIVNASGGGHPLHLHGFFFTVDSRGDGIADHVYPNATDRDRRVTELVEPGSTFTMTWKADRPGNWLFHCHLSFHAVGHLPMEVLRAGKNTISAAAYVNEFVPHAGMGGLILAVRVRGPAPAVAAAAARVDRRVALGVERAPDDRPDAPSFRYVVDGATDEHAAIGAPIVLTRGKTYAFDITNALDEPTAVHWHGIELADSYYDGVAGYSGDGGRIAPMIDPGHTFEAILTPPRAGTYIYHTHMDDVRQLRGGLAGPLIVLEPGTVRDPSSDHVFTITTTHSIDDEDHILINGVRAPPPMTCHAGVTQRLRFINVTTFWTNAIVSLSDGRRTVRWTPLAVDGADVAPQRRVPEAAVETVTIGQTRDFTFVPSGPGELQLQFWPDPSVPNIVTVPIHVVE